MLTKIEVFGENLQAAEFPLNESTPSSDPIHIRNIEGLGPVKAEVGSTQFATGRGAFYPGKSTGIRNIVLTLGLNPNWADQTVASLRQLLYVYFMPELWTKLRFFSDDLPVVGIEGIVESFEPNMFSQDPEIQVSIICHQPDFIEYDPIIVNGIVPNSLTDGDPIEAIFDYDGTVPTGFELRVESSDAKPTYTGQLKVINEAQNISEIFDIDPVTVDTTKRFSLTTVRNIRRVRTVDVADGLVEDLLGQMAGNSQWPELKPGQNTLSVAAEESGLTWTLIYFNRFGGI